MSTEAALLAKVTTPKYLAGAADQTVRGRFWLSAMKKAGRIKNNHSGDRIIWDVLAREPQARSHTSGVGMVYIQNDAYEQLSLPIAGIVGGDALDMRVQMLNKSPHAIVELYGTKLDLLLKAVSNTLSRQLYVSNSGDNTRLVGLATPMVADGSVSSNDLVAVPSSSATYGGKSVQLGALGGSWSSNLSATERPSSVALNDWPYGSGSAHYDYLTPKMLNAASTKWTGNSGANTWFDNCEHMMRRANSWTRALGGDQSKPTIHLLNNLFFDQFRDSFVTRERIMISDYAKGLGFEGIYNYDGAAVAMDYDCPANKGYAFNYESADIELHSAHDNLFFTAGPTFSMEDLANQFLVGFFGALKYNPKHICEYGIYGS